MSSLVRRSCFECEGTTVETAREEMVQAVAGERAQGAKARAAAVVVASVVVVVGARERAMARAEARAQAGQAAAVKAQDGVALGVVEVQARAVTETGAV
jgi:hypothetical protein